MAKFMNESILRQEIANTILQWKGAKRGSDTHKKILSIYNNHKPLARGYEVQVSDSWCATTVSAVWITLGIDKFIDTECSCTYLIENAKKKGYWVEDDAYKPGIGDCILYDWDSKTAAGDNTGSPEHIGIVIAVNNTKFTVLEGNRVINNVSIAATREVPYDWRYTRGFIVLDYKAIAEVMNKANGLTENKKEDDDMISQEQFEAMYANMMAKKKDNDSSTWSKEAREWAIKNGIISGVGKLPDGSVNYAWEDIPTREQFVTFLYRFEQMLKNNK